MPKFGKKSISNRKDVDSRLLKICDLAIEIFDFTIEDGIRTLEEQRILVATKKSKTMNSKHLDGLAVDLAPYGLTGIDWKDTEMFCVLAGVMFACAHRTGVKLRWGGDWNQNHSTRDENFRDYGHFEIVE